MKCSFNGNGFQNLQLNAMMSICVGNVSLLRFISLAKSTEERYRVSWRILTRPTLNNDAVWWGWWWDEREMENCVRVANFDSLTGQINHLRKSNKSFISWEKSNTHTHTHSTVHINSLDNSNIAFKMSDILIFVEWGNSRIFMEQSVFFPLPPTLLTSFWPNFSGRVGLVFRIYMFQMIIYRFFFIFVQGFGKIVVFRFKVETFDYRIADIANAASKFRLPFLFLPYCHFYYCFLHSN